MRREIDLKRIGSETTGGMAMIIAMAWVSAPVPARARASALQPQLIGDESYSESFTVIADLRDGTYVQVQLSVSNLGLGDGHGSCRLLVVEPGREAWTAATKLDRDEWRFFEDPMPRLAMGPCYVWSARHTEIHAAVGSAIVHLSLDAPLRSVRPPGSRIEDDGGFYSYEVLIPWAAVNADISLPGRKFRSAEGFGYADALRTTLTPAKVARQWVRFRSLGGAGSLLLISRTPPGGAKATGWVWRQGESTPVATGPIEAIRVGGQPGQWLVEAQTQSGLLQIRSQRLLFRYAPVEQFGFLGILARPIVGNPVTKTYRASVTPTSGGSSRTGILEISNVE